MDEDGWTDIVVACDSTPSLLLMNNHDGTFREEALLRGVALSGEGLELGGMGIGTGDYDLDGHLDIVKTHFQGQSTGVYHNDGKGEDFERTSPSQVGLGAERRFISWGTGFVDFDNDGYPDVMVVTGTVYQELEKVYTKYPARNPRLLFRNQGNGTFVQLGDEAGAAIAARHISRGAAFGDFDNDGDMDVLIMNMNEPPSLLRNDALLRQPLDQGSPRRNQKQPKRHRSQGPRPVRRQGTGPDRNQSVQLPLRQRPAPALWPRIVLHGRH